MIAFWLFVDCSKLSSYIVYTPHKAWGYNGELVWTNDKPQKRYTTNIIALMIAYIGWMIMPHQSHHFFVFSVFIIAHLRASMMIIVIFALIFLSIFLFDQVRIVWQQKELLLSVLSVNYHPSLYLCCRKLITSLVTSSG